MKNYVAYIFFLLIYQYKPGYNSIAGFALKSPWKLNLPWKVLEYTGLSWKVLEN